MCPDSGSRTLSNLWTCHQCLILRCRGQGGCHWHLEVLHQQSVTRCCGQWGCHFEVPYPQSVSTSIWPTDTRWRQGPREELKGWGLPWRWRWKYKNKLESSFVCPPPPITWEFSPAGYNLVLRRCHHARVVLLPVAVGDSEQFAHLFQQHLPVTCVASARCTCCPPPPPPPQLDY